MSALCVRDVTSPLTSLLTAPAVEQFLDRRIVRAEQIVCIRRVDTAVVEAILHVGLP